MMLSTQNKALQVSLRCLTHPLSLTMVGLLLLNDRLLKWQFASWWTGKLSDVAGLFFFPFVLTTVISLFWRRRSVGPATIFLVGWLFTLIKVIPAINELAIQLWSALLNAPVAIALDPSDLLALPVLGLAALLWEREWDRPVPAKLSPAFTLFATSVWSLTLLASLASSCPSDDRIFVIAQINDDYYVYSDLSENSARLDLNTLTWEATAWPSEFSRAEFTSRTEACLPDTDICYQLDNPGAVNKSVDGGLSWQTAWQYPFGRLEYMQRDRDICGSVDTELFDIVIIPGETQGSHLVVIAAGSQGVIVKDLEDNWQRMAVLYANPSPLQANSLETAFFDVIGEVILATGVAFISSVLLLLIGWRNQSVFKRLLLSVAIALIVLGLNGYLAVTALETIFLITTPVSYLALWLASSVVVSRGHTKDLLQPNAADALPVWQQAVILNHLLPAACFILWALGVIPHITIAYILALLIFSAIYWKSSRQIKHALKTTAPLAEFEIGPEKWP
ncbi:MAG: hypothetical protein KDE59_09740 [Anaerolineales bacterium]|nr:hypothetical protein [Anaerolineales bacterium]